MKKVDGRVIVSVVNDLGEIKPLPVLVEKHGEVQWSIVKPCNTRPFPEYSFEISFIPTSYICHWSRNEFGEVQYEFPLWIRNA